jgi:hypothetical protein
MVFDQSCGSPLAPQQAMPQTKKKGKHGLLRLGLGLGRYVVCLARRTAGARQSPCHRYVMCPFALLAHSELVNYRAVCWVNAVHVGRCSTVVCSLLAAGREGGRQYCRASHEECGVALGRCSCRVWCPDSPGSRMSGLGCDHFHLIQLQQKALREMLAVLGLRLLALNSDRDCTLL